MTFGFPSLPFTSPEWMFVVLIGIALVAPVLAKRVKLPGLLGLIVAGAIIGPHGLGIVVRDGFVATMGSLGVLYLFFMAGLELDLRGALQKYRTDTIVFGVATFSIPLVIGVVVLQWMGMDTLPAVLLASTWSTHTVIAYPIFQRYGVVNNRGVTVAVGGTLITNITGLLVLAVVVALHVAEQDMGGVDATTWLVMSGGLAALAAVTLFGLPRLTRWFFAGLGDDRLVQVLYVFTILFAAAAFASAVGIEAIIGAFFAGLGLNEHIPKKGVLGDRMRFLGDVLLVPLFLISVGMLINPASLVAGWTIVLLGLSYVAQSQGGKLIAAIIVGRIRGFSRDETGAMFSLTAADAAATLAAVLIGLEVGLFEQQIIEAIVLVILCSCTLATVTGERYAPRIAAPPPDDAAIGRNVVVAVANPHTAGRLTELGARFAGTDDGTVFPVNVLGPDADRDEILKHDSLLSAAETSALRIGVEAQGSVRVADSSTTGVVHQVVERDATLAMLGWKGFASAREHVFGSLTDEVVRQLKVPTILCRIHEGTEVQRILVHAGRPRSMPLHGTPLAVNLARRLANSYQVPLVIVGSDKALERLDLGNGSTRRLETVTDEQSVAKALAAHAQPGDLVVVGAEPLGHIREPEIIAGRLPDHDLLIVIGPRQVEESTPVLSTV